MTISPSAFEKQVRRVVARGYQSISTTELADWYLKEKPLPKKPVLFTFDDAYSEITANALPTLQKFGLKATVCVVTSQLGGTNAWDLPAGRAQEPLMSEDQIRHWNRQRIEFASHSHTHADLTKLSEDNIMRELETSRSLLEGITQRSVPAFAYPFGCYDSCVVRCVSRVFSLGLSCIPGLNDVKTNRNLIRRASIDPRCGFLDPFVELHLGYNPFVRLRTQLGRLRGNLLKRQ